MIVFLLNGITSGLLAAVWAWSAGSSIWMAALCYALGGMIGLLTTVALQVLTDGQGAARGQLLPQVADR